MPFPSYTVRPHLLYRLRCKLPLSLFQLTVVPGLDCVVYNTDLQVFEPADCTLPNDFVCWIPSYVQAPPSEEVPQ